MTLIEKKACAFFMACILCFSGCIFLPIEKAYAEEVTETVCENEMLLDDVILEDTILEDMILDEVMDIQDLPEQNSDTEQFIEEVVIEEGLVVDEGIESLLVLGTEEETTGDWNYQFVNQESGTIKITGYTGTETELVIPSTLMVSQDTNQDDIDTSTETAYQVVQIGEKAFEENESIIAVTIPNTVTEIQYAAFVGCSALKTITVAGDSILQVIGDYAFSKNSQLQSFECPDSLRTIGKSAFAYDTELENILLNDEIKEIGARAFQYSGLKEITFPETIHKIPMGICMGCDSLTKVILSITTKEIDDTAFANCRQLAEIDLPSALEVIGDSAFSGSGLLSIEFPASLLYIGDKAFYATRLTEIDIPDTVIGIDKRAFGSCSNLTKVKMGKGITYIEESTFYNCDLREIVIGNRVEAIGRYAFERNKNLTSIIIPESVTELQYQTFADCSNLISITLPDMIERIYGKEFVNTAWYDGQPDGEVYIGKAFYAYKGAMLENYTLKIRQDTRCIAGFSCTGYKNLTSVILPEGLVGIGYGAFAETGLKDIYIPASVTQIDKGAVGYKDVYISFDNNDSPEPTFKGEIDADFTIYGYPGTAAETYANTNGIRFTALKKDISQCVISGIDSSYVYTGQEIVPNITVRDGQQIISADNYTVSYKDNKNIGKATVTIKGKGNFFGTKTVSFVIQPKLTIKRTAYTKMLGDAAFNLKAKVNGEASLKYISSDKKVVTVSSKGNVKIIGTGKATITIRATKNNVQTEKVINITVNSARMKKPSLKVKKQTMTISWKKVKGISGYELQYSTSKKFTDKKTVTVKILKNSITEKKIKKLKSKTTYYVRIRDYGRNDQVGIWSKTAKIKMK